MVEFKVSDIKQALEGELIHNLGNGIILIRISGKEHTVRLIRSSFNEFEFLLDHSFHYAKVLESTTAEIKISVDGQQMLIKKHSKLTEILGKSSAIADVNEGGSSLVSQIPGRVVSVLPDIGASIRKGDSLILLESMKMQVAVRAHKDGIVKEIRVKEGTTVARNDIIAIIE